MRSHGLESLKQIDAFRLPCGLRNMFDCYVYVRISDDTMLPAHVRPLARGGGPRPRPACLEDPIPSVRVTLLNTSVSSTSLPSRFVPANARNSSSNSSIAFPIAASTFTTGRRQSECPGAPFARVTFQAAAARRIARSVLQTLGPDTIHTRALMSHVITRSVLAARLPNCKW